MHLRGVLFLTGLGAALLAVLAAAFLTRRGLRPLERLAGAAGEIERTGDPARRLPETAETDEIGQLTGVLNRMRASLERSRATERRFQADASPELRTPVTALLGNVDYAARHGADPEVLTDLQRDAERLARLVDDLLVLERSGGGGQEPGPVELDGVVREVAARHPDGRVVVGPVVAAEVYGDREALARSLDNLIENGLVHGPDGGRVKVTLGRRETVAVLAVSDGQSGAVVRAGLAGPGVIGATWLRAGPVDRLGDRRAPPRDDLGRRLVVHRRTSAFKRELSLCSYR